MVLGFLSGSYGQSISVGSLNPGPYGYGSTIAVPVTITDPAGSLLINNTFDLYISDASGSFASETKIGTYIGVYTTFVNGFIPPGLTPGSYKLRVKTTSPQITSAASSNIIVAPAQGVMADVDGNTLTPLPKTFGYCLPRLNTFRLNNASTSGATVTAVVKNEMNPADVNTLSFASSSQQSFSATFTHYTIFVTAELNGIVGTQAFFLINNRQFSPFTNTGSETVCLPGIIEYSIESSSPSGVQNNFPGNVYRVDWGDGSSIIYTIWQLKALNNKISHLYTSSSCGQQVATNTNTYYNVFGINLQQLSPYCQVVGPAGIGYAKVITPPENRFSPNTVACLNTELTIFNTSISGEDPSSNSPECVNSNVVYYWYVDNQLITPNGVPITYQLKYKFTTPGTHIVRLESESTSACQAAPVTREIYVQSPPQPAFSIPSDTYCSSTAIQVTDNSVTDNNAPNTYAWTFFKQNGASWTAVNPQYSTGSTSSSKNPSFKFTSSGVYKIRLTITSSCADISATDKVIYVDTFPATSSSWTTAFCGKGQTLTFNSNSGNPVRTIYSGTASDRADTYTWTVTGGAYSFKSGTNASSKFPVILFEDYATYTVSVKHQNSCGSFVKNGSLSFKESPTVTAGNDVTICAGNNVTLDGSITGPPANTFAWEGGTGTFSPGRNVLKPTYTPSAAEIAAGSVELVLSATTSNPSPCNIVKDMVMVTINPLNKITSANSLSICTGTAVNYQPVALVSGSTISWTATGSSNASGFSNSGTGNINDVISNTAAGTDATVTYIITPQANGCPGDAFTFTVSVRPLPLLTVTGSNDICTGKQAGIVLSSDLSDTKYTWTSTVTGNITGNSGENIATAATSINDILVNQGNTPGTVTYIITPVNATGCTGLPFTRTITVSPAPVVANAGADQNLCNLNTATLAGNHPGSGTGHWTLTSGQTGVSYDDQGKFDAQVSGLQTGEVYRFVWTVSGPGNCDATSDEVTVNVYPALSANTVTWSGGVVCQGAAVTVTGSMPAGGNGTYSYTWEISTDGINWSNINITGEQDIQVAISETTRFRRTVSSGNCSITSNEVSISVQPGVSNNNISNDQTICSGMAPSEFQGSEPAGGDGTYLYQWQLSIDGGNNWSNIISATASSYQAPVLSQTTFYRRLVSSGSCTGSQQSISNPVKVTVNFNPLNGITSVNTLTICTGTNINYHPVTTILGSIVTWAATGSSNAQGFSASGTGDITDILSNLSTTLDATVTYSLVYNLNGCQSGTFTLTVTIKPTPVMNAVAVNNIICSGQRAGINLSSNLDGTKYTWTSSVTGDITGNTTQNTPVSLVAIPDLLVNSGTGTGTVTYVISPLNSAGCEGTPFTITIDVSAAPVTANAGTDQKLCGVGTVQLAGNAAGNGTGKWTVISGQAGLIFDDDTRPDAIVTGIIPGRIYRFLWSISGAGNCNPSSDEVVVNNLQTLSNNTVSYLSVTACEGISSAVSGSTPAGGDGAYSYIWETSTDSTSWTQINTGDQRDLQVILSETSFLRRIVLSGGCSNVSNVIRIEVLKSLSNNTISGQQKICMNSNPAKLEGSNPAGADGNYFYQWQQSTDGGSTWSSIISASAISLQPPALNITTFYRRIVTSSACSGKLESISNSIEIKVAKNLVANFSWTSEVGCAPFVLTDEMIKADASEPGDIYKWYANNVSIGEGTDFPGYTINDIDQQVNIRLDVTSPLGCGNKTFSHTFITNTPAPADFIPDNTQGCGPLTVNFSNKTKIVDGLNFIWDFGNGIKSNLKTPQAITFQPRGDGRDTVYKVTLTAFTACSSSSKTVDITVIGAPQPKFSPSRVEGCSPLTVTFKNLSPGNSNTYIWDFGDGSAPETYTDNRQPEHIFRSGVTRTFTVRLTIKNDCTEKTLTHTIKISPNKVNPDMVVSVNQLSGCAPHTVKFYNYTTGATTFTYDFNDESALYTTNNTDEVLHTFTKSGTYFVKLTASNCSDTSIVKKIVVYEGAEAGFTADVTEGCAPLTVKFNNTTKNAVSYLWDLGDGTTSAAVNPPSHIYSNKQASYTVKLITKSPFGCIDTLVMKDFITISPTPVAAFEVLPRDHIQYPEYRFSFKNNTKGDFANIIWDFGDGSTANDRDPSHAYADTGSYKVKMIVTNNMGCADVYERTVRISGVPGSLFVPNAFMPNSVTEELRTFKTKGSGIATWHIRIFNKWGEPLWETEKLDENGSPSEFWDGTKNGVPVPQGVYFWEITAKFINGTEWGGMPYKNSNPKRIGDIHLIR